jgi:hypothetical protein
MAWTTPKTWTTSELVTASLLNTHLRDNLNYLYGGKEAFFVPAEAMRPTETSGAAPILSTELTAGQPEAVYLAFDASADEYVQFRVKMPQKWNLSTVSFEVNWTTTATDTGGVAWALQAVAIGDGEDMDVAFGTAVVVADDGQSNAYDHLSTGESDTVTIAGSPTDGDWIVFQLFRDVSDGDDDMEEDALLMGITIYYTTDQPFEAL